MLKYADTSDKECILGFTDDGAFGTKVKAIINAYGIDSSLVDVWFDEGKTVAVRFDGAMALYCTPETDTEELRQLIKLVGCTAVFCERRYAGLLTENFRHGTVMKYAGEKENSHCEDASENLREIYSLISENIPGSFPGDGYMYWLSDFMHRFLRGLSRARCVKENNSVAACCVTSAETQAAAVISGVVCAKEFRSRGFGRQCVLGLTNELTDEMKSVYVFVLNENAAGFYKKIGFEECGEWAEYKI